MIYFYDVCFCFVLLHWGCLICVCQPTISLFRFVLLFYFCGVVIHSLLQGCFHFKEAAEARGIPRTDPTLHLIQLCF